MSPPTGGKPEQSPAHDSRDPQGTDDNTADEDNDFQCQAQHPGNLTPAARDGYLHMGEALPAENSTNLEQRYSPGSPRSPAEAVIALERLTRSIRRATSTIRSSSADSNETIRGSSTAITQPQRLDRPTLYVSSPSPETVPSGYSPSKDQPPDTQGLGILGPRQTSVPTYPAIPVLLSSPPGITVVNDTIITETPEADVSEPSSPSTSETDILASFPTPPSASSGRKRDTSSPRPFRRTRVPPIAGPPPTVPLLDRPTPAIKVKHPVGAVLAARPVNGPSPTTPETLILEGDHFEVPDEHPSGGVLVMHLRLGMKVRIPAELLLPSPSQAQRSRSRVRFDIAANEEYEPPSQEKDPVTVKTSSTRRDIQGP